MRLRLLIAPRLLLLCIADRRRWSDVVKALTEGAGSFARDDGLRWKADFWAAISRPAGLADALNASSQVLVPFSGGDVRTALAISPSASEYILADRSTFFAAVHPLSWNDSMLDAAVLGARHILMSSHGGAYELGHLVRRYTDQFGLVALLLAALTDVRVLDVSEATIWCSRRTSTFVVRHVSGDLHKEDTITRLAAMLRPDVTALLKGTELGLQLRHRTALNFNGTKYNVDKLLAKQQQRNRGAFHLATLILRSNVIVQDFTGVPFRRLRAWADSVYAFGSFATTSDDPDERALADFFQAQPTFDLGHLRFGYCIELRDQDAASVFGSSLSLLRGIIIADDEYATHSKRSGQGRNEKRRAYCHLVVAVNKDASPEPQLPKNRAEPRTVMKS